MGWNPLIELGLAVQTNGTTSVLAPAVIQISCVGAHTETGNLQPSVNSNRAKFRDEARSDIFLFGEIF